MHVHLNHDQCMEILAVRGEMARLSELHERIQAQKGVQYAELSVTYLDHEQESGHIHSTGHLHK